MVDDDARTLSDERHRLLHELEVERNQLVRNIETCRIRDIERPFIGGWSLKDIVGHIATWEAEIVTAFRDIREGRTPALYEFDESKIDAWNRDHVERKRDLEFWSVLHQLKGGRSRLLEEIELVSDEDLLRDGSRRGLLVRSALDHDREHWHDLAAKLAGMEGARHTGPASVVEDAHPA